MLTLRHLGVCVTAAASTTPSIAAEDPLELIWAPQTGDAGLQGYLGAVIDASGDILVAGHDNPGPSAIAGAAVLDRFSPSGELLWSRRYGEGEGTGASSLALDQSGNLYMSAATLGSLGQPSAGNLDALLIKCDGSGDIIWLRQVGTEHEEQAIGVAVNEQDGVYFAIDSGGDFGAPSGGLRALVLMRYAPDGTELWRRQYPTTHGHMPSDIAYDDGAVYVCGV